MTTIYLVFGDKCFMFVLARPLEHKCSFFSAVFFSAWANIEDINGNCATVGL